MNTSIQKQKGQNQTGSAAMWIIGIVVIAVIVVYVVVANSHKMATVTDATASSTDANGNPLPVLDSISPTQGSIGTQFTVNGSYLAGFEGDKDLWIVNSDGVKGVIYGATSSTDSMITFTLASKYCTADVSYSGGVCPSYVTIAPGSYSIFARPWGTASNVLTIQVGASMGSSDTNVWKTYTNHDFAYSIQYPSKWGLMNLTNNTPQFSVISIPMVGTNSSAQVGISVGNDTSNCYMNDMHGTSTIVAMLNGISYHIGSSGDQGMGGRTGFELNYATIHNSKCYQIALSSDLARGMSPDQKLIDEFKQVVATFTFTN